jgi:hypothetical protein
MNAKTMMLVASVMGAWAGMLFSVAVHPESNYFIFMGLFAIVGVGVGNLALLALYKVYGFAAREKNFQHT